MGFLGRPHRMMTHHWWLNMEGYILLSKTGIPYRWSGVLQVFDSQVEAADVITQWETDLDPRIKIGWDIIPVTVQW